MANYGTEAGFETYTDARAITVPSGDVVAALTRASFYIDGKYGYRFRGSKVGGRAQELQWPLEGMIDGNGASIDEASVPREIEYATYEAALRELASPGSLSPDVTAGKVKKRVRVEGAVEVEYAVGDDPVAASMPTIGVIDGLIDNLLGKYIPYGAVLVV